MILMKGITNGSKMGSVTIKTGLTVDDFKNIPDDVPWDLEYIYSDNVKTFLHGVGPVSTFWKPIIGTRHELSSNVTNVSLFSTISIYQNKVHLNYKRIGGSGGTTVTTGSTDLTDTVLATSATLYLYDGGGESDYLISCAHEGVCA
jgi:hypothetical protein